MNRKEFIKSIISEHPKEVNELLQSYMPGGTLDVPHILTMCVRYPGFAEKLYSIYETESEFSNTEGDEPKIDKLNFFKILQTAGAIKGGLDTLKNKESEEPSYEMDLKTKKEEEEAKKIIGVKKPIFFGGVGILVLILIAYFTLK